MKSKEQKPVVEQPQVQPSVVEHHVDKKTMWFLVGIPLVAILILGAFVGGMLWASNQSDDVRDITPYVSDDEVDDEVDDEDEEDEEILIEYSNFDEDLSVSWYPDSQRHDVDPLIDFDAIDVNEGMMSGMSIVVGEVDTGTYQGYELVLNSVQTVGMGTSFHYFYTLVDPNGEKDTIILDNYSSYVSDVFSDGKDYGSAQDYFDYDDELFSTIVGAAKFDTLISVPDLDFVETLETTNGHEFSLRGVWHHEDAGPYDFTDHEIVGYTTGPGYPVYQVPEVNSFVHSFIVTRLDGRLMIYEISIPFFTTTEYESGVPNMTWNNGDEVRDYIKALPGGCGYAAFTNVIAPDDLPFLTRTTGVTAQGDDVFEPLPPDAYYDDLFETWQLWNKDGTRDEFIATHPIFFWKDSLGRTIQFTHNDALGTAECGKPVIYLYPEETTHMVVEVEPQGGFTYTEPDYGDGWEVIAYPDGYVKNIADNEIYPYLFWEGRGGLYAEPQNYWVLSQEEVEPFLVKTLARFGFEGREIWEFMEFWVPRMQDAEYYKIGFHGNEVMDAIAPLTLSQQPDNVLRVLMDFTELDGPAPSNPPRHIPVFERKGFFVTEWGGVIR